MSLDSQVWDTYVHFVTLTVGGDQGAMHFQIPCKIGEMSISKDTYIIHMNLLPKKIWRNFLENWLKIWRILMVLDISKMGVNNAKITYHVQRDVHLHFLSPLIKKSNSSICIVYLSFLYPETKHKSYLLWETNLRLAKPRTLFSSCNLSLPLNNHYEVLFTEHSVKKLLHRFWLSLIYFKDTVKPV